MVLTQEYYNLRAKFKNSFSALQAKEKEFKNVVVLMAIDEQNAQENKEVDVSVNLDLSMVAKSYFISKEFMDLNAQYIINEDACRNCLGKILDATPEDNMDELLKIMEEVNLLNSISAKYEELVKSYQKFYEVFGVNNNASSNNDDDDQPNS